MGPLARGRLGTGTLTLPEGGAARVRVLDARRRHDLATTVALA